MSLIFSSLRYRGISIYETYVVMLYWFYLKTVREQKMKIKSDVAPALAAQSRQYWTWAFIDTNIAIVAHFVRLWKTRMKPTLNLMYIRLAFNEEHKT